jgi:hypothetical protein
VGTSPTVTAAKRIIEALGLVIELAVAGLEAEEAVRQAAGER